MGTEISTPVKKFVTISSTFAPDPSEPFSFSPSPTGLGVFRQHESRKHSQTLRSCQTPVCRATSTPVEMQPLGLDQPREDALLVSGAQDTLGPKACEWQRHRLKQNGQKQRLHGTDAMCEARCLVHSPGLGSRLDMRDKPTLMKACIPLSINYVSLTRIGLKVRIFLCTLMCSDAGTDA